MTRKKLRKELRDQSLHFLWSGTTFLLPFVAHSKTGPPWSAALFAVAVLSFVVIVARECWQKRRYPLGILSNFPWLDASFYALGAIAGAVVGAVWVL